MSNNKALKYWKHILEIQKNIYINLKIIGDFEFKNTFLILNKSI